MKKDKYPLMIFSVAIVAFYLFFTHLIIKTDDGHFIGILNNENFTLIQWLKERYLTISGRTASEFMMMSFLKINPFFWKLTASASLIFIVRFLQKLCQKFLSEDSDAKVMQSNVFCCCVPFLVFIGALNPAVFWFAGSFTFLFTFTAFLLAVAPLTFEFFEIDYNKWIYNIIAVFAALLSGAQEQTAALTVAFFAVLIFATAVKRTFRAYHIPPVIVSVVSAVWLFTSPGMSGRLKAESGAFERFNEMGVAEKLLCGFSNYFSYSFFMSVIVLAMFCIPLYMTVSKLYESKFVKVFSKLFLAVTGAVSLGVNVLCLAVKKTVPDKSFQEVFQKGRYDLTDILALCAGFLLLSFIFIMLFMIIKKDRKAGFTVTLLFAASVCSGVVMGLSSSIYASGQRVFFFTDILTLFASAILLASMKDKKSTVVYNVAKIIALIMFIINCFNFALLEIPIMG